MDMGFVELWGHMGFIARAVVIMLAIMSVWSIGVMIERWITYRKARMQSAEFAPAVADALKRGNLKEAIEIAEQFNKSHLAKVVHSGLSEFSAHENSNLISGETIEASKRACERSIAIERENFKRGLGGLATIGSTAVFIGLFGTTIGIINAFAGMSAGEDTGLAAVAAGISEALVATAFGLFVAVPAVWMYNHFITKLESFMVEMDNSSSELIDYFLKRQSQKTAKV